ncbi:MAG: type I-E CRISPR-associated protein Cse2/CasB [Candidatus Brocadiia bacterium]
MSRTSVDGFLDSLESLRKREDRGALAALRRGLGKPPGTVAEMHPIVVPRLPAGLSHREEDLYYLVSSLFAYHQQAGDIGNLGETFRRVRSATDSDSVEKRFVALLNCHVDDLPDHLRHAVSLAESKEVPVNYRRLLKDLGYWDHPDRFVQRQWARSFWAPAEDDREDTETDE